jgi:uncharacterized protein (DUF2336 family)
MDVHKLTEADVRLLMQDPSPENRWRTAESVARQFGSGRLSEGERRLAEEIFRLLMKDAEVRVRESLSRQLRECPTVPHDVALSLARDVDSVALPMLVSSEVLTDDDLVAIVRSSGAAKQLAVASRPAVSEVVSEALVDTGDETVVTGLVANPRARMDEAAMQRVVDAFGDRDAIGVKLLDRGDLPITVVERLVARASESLRQELLRRCSAPEAMATEVLLHARERTMLGLLGDNVPENDVEALVTQLDAHGRLTSSIVIRALCMGDLAFFESAMARLARIGIVNARTLIYDAGPLGLKAVFEKAGLSAALFPAARAGVNVAREIQLDGEPHDRERRSRKIMERVLTQYGDLGVDLESADLDYLLGRMGQRPSG